MSCNHLLTVDPLSRYMNPVFNSVTAGTYNIGVLGVTNLEVDNITSKTTNGNLNLTANGTGNIRLSKDIIFNKAVLNFANSSGTNTKVGITGGANNTLSITTLDELSNWIGGSFGYIGDRFVGGCLFGRATIGGHNSSLTAWKDLTINPGGNVRMGNYISANKLSVEGNVNISSGSAYKINDAVVLDSNNLRLNGPGGNCVFNTLATVPRTIVYPDKTGTAALLSNVILNFGQNNITVTSSSFATAYSFIYPGTAAYSGPSSINYIADFTAAIPEGGVRIYDLTNAQVIAQDVPRTTAGLFTMNTITNLPVGKAVFVIQAASVGGSVSVGPVQFIG